MPKVFISYRRLDSADATGRLHDRLDAQFGRESVFMDIDSIPPGVDFRRRLSDGVRQCDVLLAVIGDHWLDAAFDGGPKAGKRRLEDPDDYVRIEIESALSLGIPVVPVLVGRASMPSERDLPEGLKSLAYKNAAAARSGQSFHESVDRLIRGLQALVIDKQTLWESFQKAHDVAAKDPELGLIAARKMLERVVREVYERRIGEPAGTRPLEKIVARLAQAGCFPFPLGPGAVLRQDVGTSPAAGTITPAEAHDGLAKLKDILKWYTEVEQPDGMGESTPSQRPPSVRASADQPPAPRLAIVPKGLRAFDAKDADFFLELLPGPRNHDGLPESLHFWKDRIEDDDQLTFTVGLIYGPSGCGKSSLMKAGLLPKLAGNVVPVYVEATADGTETRLLRGLRERCPQLPHDLELTETIQNLRQGKGLGDDHKVVIVLDQFEQWLHAKRQEESTELVQALRQCDGKRVQAVVMVRDDFWMAVTRFLAALEVDLVQGRNIAAVDLFDLKHARRVLEAFGRAYGTLPEHTTELGAEQQRFLDQAVRGLAEDGKVVCVRLALFAEMMKAKPWTPATLKEVGGTQGVGITFLEETFSAPSANPSHRLHQQAARAVLKSLLPEQGTDIKGNMRSRQELLEASGYTDRPKEVETLIRILDSDVRLITPTDPEGIDPDSPGRNAKAGERFYQLTHDYLVPSLREWLTRKQKETRRGRAELRLADRAALWKDKRENRHLPSLWEFLNIRSLTDKTKWTEPERRMMRQAGRFHGIRSGVAAAVLVVLAVSGATVARQIEEKRQADYAADLVKRLVAADITEVPGIVQEIDGYRRWADPLLRQQEAEPKLRSSQKLRLTLGLLPVDRSHVAPVRDDLLRAPPSSFVVARDALLPYKDDVAGPLWKVALDSSRPIQERFQAACALATYTPGDQRWLKVRGLVAARLVTLEASALVAWREALRPARARLIEPLATIFRNTKYKEQPRSFATETLADYSAAETHVLFNLLADSDQFQFSILFDKLADRQNRAKGIALAQDELKRLPPERASEDQKERLAKRQANAAVALLRLGHADKLLEKLKFSPDPRVRSDIIHWISPLGGELQEIVQRIDTEPDVTIRRALVLTIGEFTDKLSDAQRQPLIEKLADILVNEPDAGLHGAAQWLLGKLGQEKRVEALLEKLKADDTHRPNRRADGKQWYINTQRQTFVLVDAREGSFLMGSPESEPDREAQEGPYFCRIGRRFAISAREVTKAQYRAFQQTVKGFDLANYAALRQIVRTDDSPQTGVTWYEAAHYCDWLSEQEKIPRDQWCYDPHGGAYAPGMKAKEKFWELTGYRLPTEAEWEFACRAGSVTSRYYGLSEDLLPQYAWFTSNGENHTWPGGRLEPNDFGLFDMMGNAWEWCFDSAGSYPKQNDAEKVFEDGPKVDPAEDAQRVLRGAAFFSQPRFVRSAYRFFYKPGTRHNLAGFRPVRTFR